MCASAPAATTRPVPLLVIPSPNMSDARRGRSVLVLERFEQGHERGSSHGSSRIFRLAYPVHRYVRMAQAAPDADASTAGQVLASTLRSNHGDASRTYWRSSSIISAAESRSRLVTCQRPVIPGGTFRRL